MKELKFRAWNGKEMRYGVGIGNYGNPIRNGYQWFNEENDVHNSEPLQYTGLKDKNGKEIYEGDIVKDKWKEKYTVKWQDDLTGFYPFADCPSNCGHCGSGESPADMEIIGNIYENPGLK